MLYAIIILSALDLCAFFYIMKHVVLINRELDDVHRQVIKANEDIIHLLKMDLEISKVVDNHAKGIVQLNTAMEYIFDKDSKTDKKQTNNIFEPPHGQA